jgi:arsenite methyltransferase
VSQLAFDESLAQQLEYLYRTRDVLHRRKLVRAALDAKPGERVLDVGCGPGFYVAELLEQVGPTGSVVGVDNSGPMLAVATERCRAHQNAAFHEAEATSLPVESATFDAALCVQVLEYVLDVGAALREIRRALRPGGRLVVWDVDWTTVSLHSSDPGRTDRMLRAWDEHLAHPSLPRTLTAELRSAGFEAVRMEAHAFATNELTPEAYGGSVVRLIEDFAAGRHGVTEDEAKAWGEDLRGLGKHGEFYFACIQSCFKAQNPA